MNEKQDRPFQRQPPGNDGDVFRQTHGKQHLRPEHSTVTHLYPLLQSCTHTTIHMLQHVVNNLQQMPDIKM